MTTTLIPEVRTGRVRSPSGPASRRTPDSSCVQVSLGTAVVWQPHHSPHALARDFPWITPADLEAEGSVVRPTLRGRALGRR